MDLQYLVLKNSSLNILYCITSYITKSSVGVDIEYSIFKAAILKSFESPLDPAPNLN